MEVLVFGLDSLIIGEFEVRILDKRDLESEYNYS